MHPINYYSPLSSVEAVLKIPSIDDNFDVYQDGHIDNESTPFDDSPRRNPVIVWADGQFDPVITKTDCYQQIHKLLVDDSPLNKSEKELVNLYLQGHTNGEIAQIRGVSTSAISQSTAKAFQKARDYLDPIRH
jgi:hypothetical protein